MLGMESKISCLFSKHCNNQVSYVASSNKYFFKNNLGCILGMNIRRVKFNHSYLVDSCLGQVNREVCYNCDHDTGDKEHSQGKDRWRKGCCGHNTEVKTQLRLVSYTSLEFEGTDWWSPEGGLCLRQREERELAFSLPALRQVQHGVCVSIGASVSLFLIECSLEEVNDFLVVAAALLLEQTRSDCLLYA